MNSSPGGERARQKEQKAKAEGKITRQMQKKDQQVQTKQNIIQKGNGKKLENCFMLLFVISGVNLGIVFCTQVTPLNFCCIVSKSRGDDQQTVNLPNEMSEDLFAGLSAAEGDKRAVSLCDQGHALHTSPKVCNPPTSLPALFAHPTHAQGWG